MMRSGESGPSSQGSSFSSIAMTRFSKLRVLNCLRKESRETGDDLEVMKDSLQMTEVTMFEGFELIFRIGEKILD